MRKYIWPLLTVLLLLAGCTTQPSDPTPTVSPEAIKPTSFTLNVSDMSFFNPGEIYDLKVRLGRKAGVKDDCCNNMGNGEAQK